MIFKSHSFKRVYSTNNVDALVPEWWAMMSLAVLESQMVIGNRVHRDFENELAQYGDVVNTRKPAAFQANRKTNADSVTVQNATLNNIQVPLDQHIHVSFDLKDGEISKSKKDLVQEFLAPAMTAHAEFLDAVLLGQYHRFIRNADVGGQLDSMTSANAWDYILDAREALNVTKAPFAGRTLHLPPRMETKVLKDTNFLTADKIGDEGSALREANLGRKMGFDIFMGQNGASVRGSFTARSFQVNNAAGYAIGDTAMTVDTGTGEITNGTWVKIGGQPYQVAAHTGTTPTTSITLAVALRAAVADNDVITVYTPGAVNLVAGYAAGYAKSIIFDGFAGTTPQVGQMVTFATHSGAQIYTVIQATATTIVLDRPLAAAIADNDAINIAPPGDYGLAHTRNALSFVSRPLAMPPAGVGALSGVAVHNGFAMRATLSYNGTTQALLVTLDLLCGVALLDANLGAVLLG